MRYALQAGLTASLIVLASCKGDSTIAADPGDGAITYKLNLIDGTGLPQATSTHLYVVGGQLKLHPNGVFSEQLTKTITQPVGAHAVASEDYSELASGRWAELPGQRYELQYTDRIPVRLDTAVVTGVDLTKNCRPYWCGGPMVMTFRR